MYNRASHYGDHLSMVITKGAFYFHFSRGEAQVAEDAVELYVTGTMAVPIGLSPETVGDTQAFVKRVFDSFAQEKGRTEPARSPSTHDVLHIRAPAFGTKT